MARGILAVIKPIGLMVWWISSALVRLVSLLYIFFLYHVPCTGCRSCGSLSCVRHGHRHDSLSSELHSMHVKYLCNSFLHGWGHVKFLGWCIGNSFSWSKPSYNNILNLWKWLFSYVFLNRRPHIVTQLSMYKTASIYHFILNSFYIFS